MSHAADTVLYGARTYTRTSIPEAPCWCTRGACSARVRLYHVTCTSHTRRANGSRKYFYSPKKRRDRARAELVQLVTRRCTMTCRVRYPYAVLPGDQAPLRGDVDVYVRLSVSDVSASARVCLTPARSECFSPVCRSITVPTVDAMGFMLGCASRVRIVAAGRSVRPTPCPLSRLPPGVVVASSFSGTSSCALTPVPTWP